MVGFPPYVGGGRDGKTFPPTELFIFIIQNEVIENQGVLSA